MNFKQEIANEENQKQQLLNACCELKELLDADPDLLLKIIA